MNTNQDILRLLHRSLKSNKKLSEIKQKKEEYNQELKEIQQKYLIEFNKSDNIEEISKNLDKDMKKLHVVEDIDVEKETAEKVTVEKVNEKTIA